MARAYPGCPSCKVRQPDLLELNLMRVAGWHAVYGRRSEPSETQRYMTRDTEPNVVLIIVEVGIRLTQVAPTGCGLALAFYRGRVDDLVIGDGSSGHSLLREAIEELSSAL